MTCTHNEANHYKTTYKSTAFLLNAHYNYIAFLSVQGPPLPPKTNLNQPVCLFIIFRQ